MFFSNKQSGDFTLTITTTDTNFSYLQLTDRVTGVTIDLLQHPEYSFHATGQEFEARFCINFKMATGVEEQQQSFCFVKDGFLYVESQTDNAHLELIDVLARTVKSVRMTGNSCSIADLLSGVYFVRLNDGMGSLVQKVVIDN